MKRPNPLHPDRMTAHERRAELCGVLALGLVRLRQRGFGQISANIGESRLHYSCEQWLHAAQTDRRTA